MPMDVALEELDDHTPVPERTFLRDFPRFEPLRREPKLKDIDPQLLARYAEELRKLEPTDPQSDIVIQLVAQIGFHAATVKKHRELIHKYRLVLSETSNTEEWERRRERVETIKAELAAIVEHREELSRRLIEVQNAVHLKQDELRKAFLGQQDEMLNAAMAMKLRREFGWLIGDDAEA